MDSRVVESKARNRACTRCHQSKVACDRPSASATGSNSSDTTCSRCARLGFADQCELYVPKSYRTIPAEPENNHNNAPNEDTVSQAMKRSRKTPLANPPNASAASESNGARNGYGTFDNVSNASFQSPMNLQFPFSPYLPSTPLQIPVPDPFQSTNFGMTIRPGPSSVALDTASAAANERDIDINSTIEKRAISLQPSELRAQPAVSLSPPVSHHQLDPSFNSFTILPHQHDTFRVPTTSTSSSQLRSTNTQAQPLDSSAFLQLSQLNFRERVRSMIDRSQLTPRRLHMMCSFLSEAMIESDYIQLSSLSPVPLACSLKAEFAQSPSYHLWRSQALGLLGSSNKQDGSQQSQFVMHFDFQDSPVLCVEDEESAAGMHSVPDLERMAKIPQIATYVWTSLRSIETANKTDRKEQSNSRKRKASESSAPESVNSESDNESQHQQQLNSVQLGRSKLKQRIRLRHASTVEARSSAHADSLKHVLHVTSCPLYSKIVDLSARITTPSTSSSAETQVTPGSENSASECGCPSILHYRMCAQVNREWERMFGWSQREIRDMLIQIGGRRTEHTMFKATLPAPYEVLLLEFFLSGQLDASFPVSVFTKFNTTIPCVIREHVQITDDGDLDSITFQAYPVNR